MGVGAGGSFAVAVGDRNFGKDIAAAAGRMAVGVRRARNEGYSSAGWGGSARARGMAAGAEVGRALSGVEGRRLVVVAGCAMAAERDEAIGEVVGRGLSMVGEGDWGRLRSRCSILGLPWWILMDLGEVRVVQERIEYKQKAFVSPSLRLLFSSHDRFYGAYG